MNRIWKVVASVAIVLLTLNGCTTQGRQEQAGMVIGGALGGLLGMQVKDKGARPIAIIAGTLAGAAIGGKIGHSMDETDRLRVGQTLETVRTNVPTTWVNPDTGAQYQVTPTRTYRSNAGPCRDYTVEAIIDGRREQVVGTACREADGTWRTDS